nr:hypothetical protein [Tanacetum cinerariifolium]
YERTGRKLQFDTKDLVGYDKTKVECFNCHKMGYFSRDCRAKGNQDSRRRDAGYNGNKARDSSRRPTYQEDSNALVTIDGEDIDWSGHVEEDAKNYAMMAYSSSGSNNEVQSCSQACADSYARLKKLYDKQRDKLGDASVEITAYTLALKSAPQLDFDDLEQINDDDMEEIDLKWQVAIISMRVEKFYERTGRKLQFDTKDLVGYDKTKVECFNCHKMGYFSRDCRAKGNQDSRRRDAGYNGNKARDSSRRPTYQEDSNALVTIDGEDIDWSGHVEEDAKNYAMMAYSSSGSNNEVQSCSQACADSYARLKKLYDKQRDKLGDAKLKS